MPIITIQMRDGVLQNAEGIPPAIIIRIVSEGEVKGGHDPTFQIFAPDLVH